MLPQLSSLDDFRAALAAAPAQDQAALQAAGLLDALDFVVDSHKVGVAKPDPRIFQMGLDRMGLPVDQAIYVGDLPDVDVVGAQGAGLQAVLIDPTDHHTGLDCPRIPGISALPELLQREPPAEGS